MEAIQEELNHLNGYVINFMNTRGEQIDANISKFADDDKKLKYHLQCKKNWLKELEKTHKEIEKLNKKLSKMLKP